MKKMIIAFIMGAAIATTGSVYAEEIMNLVGTEVTVEGQFPVKVNGVTVEKPAIVLFGGTSYLPVRAIGDALNMDVKFDANLGIDLTPKEEIAGEVSSMAEVLIMTLEDEKTIQTSEEQIVIAQQRIIDNEDRIVRLKGDKAIEIDKLAATTDSLEKQSIEIEISAITAEITGAQYIVNANKGIIASTQAYIAKIKAKYQ